jgi:hypothetical protein
MIKVNGTTDTAHIKAILDKGVLLGYTVDIRIGDTTYIVKPVKMIKRETTT